MTAQPALPAFAPDQLQVGDILLQLGCGPVSELIAWCGDSIYSHAAIVADQGDLIEAAASGVRRYPLSQRLTDTTNYLIIDAYRPLSYACLALDDADRASVLAKAQSLLGVPYPLDSLATLGVLVAIRGKWPQHWLARIVVREALDHLVRDNPSHMVCSEVVYRALAECDATPPGRLAPQIVLSGPTHMPFPDLDWKALWEEVWQLLHPHRQQVLGDVAQRLAAVEGAPASLAASALTTVTDEDLLNGANAVRAGLGLPPLPPVTDQAEDNGSLLREAGEEAPGTPLPHPNPKLVMPLDLANSPSHVVLGRLLPTATPV
ncbi:MULTISPECIES: C40 family peptidase [unclassified Xanthomonas]|uniref:hypothetical protein n=1 Tax=Xanthomonas sp. LMG 9002 TaxID=1591158 RepID=UPI001F1688E7|nr:hypothetical protein [Xanthomonas sp. LMG 9002]